MQYFNVAHLFLLTAFVALALAPRSIAGFYYHPRMIAVVHLVTLGWITASILGSLYMLGPMTLDMPLKRRRLDTWAFWLFVVGTLGMTSHFWIDEPGGMVWSAGTVIIGLVLVGTRVLAGLWQSNIPPEIKAHFYLAFVNLLLAATLGLLVGADKSADVLPGRSLSNVHAHAHLAALGWVLMLVIGAATRLLPMLLPATPPRGRWVWAGALTLEVGVLGLTTSLLTGSPMAPPFGLLVLLALGLFLSRVVSMLRNRRRASRALPKPDYGVRQVFLALVSLIGAALLGALILLAPDGEWKLDALIAYGLLGLLGFFGQMVVGVSARLVPLHAWLTTPVGPDGFRPSPPPVALPSRSLERAVFWLWAVGFPCLVFGMVRQEAAVIRLAALLLACAVLAGWRSQRLILRRTRSSPSAD